MKIDKYLKRELINPPIFEEIDFDKLLNKYGPEGLYDLAKELMKVANKDVSDATIDIRMAKKFRPTRGEEDWLGGP